MRLHSFVSRGFSGDRITVEADLRKGFPGFDLVGLPDGAIRESRERVRSALRNSGIPIPRKRVLINLAPAGMHKTGSQLDLAIALIIAISQQVSEGQISLVNNLPIMVVGELALDGAVVEVQNVQGALAAARRSGCLFTIAPNQENLHASENLATVSSLSEALHVVQTRMRQIEGGTLQVQDSQLSCGTTKEPFSGVEGLSGVRKALELAAAGGHHVLLFGPPGAGKTLCASSFSGLLPPPENFLHEEISRVRSAMGELDPFPKEMRPVSMLPQSCQREDFAHEAAKCHGGVMIVDEISTLSKSVLEQLREVYDRKRVLLKVDRKLSEFPARFQMIATMNACPCGELGIEDGRCSCSQAAIMRYWKKLGSGLLDRFDIRFPVDPHGELEIAAYNFDMNCAIERQRIRFSHEEYPVRCNADLIHYPQIRTHHIHENLLNKTKLLVDGTMSVRGVISVCTLARTIADLLDKDEVSEQEIVLAIELRRYGSYDFYWRSY